MLGDGRRREAAEGGVSERVDLALGDVPHHGGGPLAVCVAQVNVRPVVQQQLHDLGGQVNVISNISMNSNECKIVRELRTSLL